MALINSLIIGTNCPTASGPIKRYGAIFEERSRKAGWPLSCLVIPVAESRFFLHPAFGSSTKLSGGRRVGRPQKFRTEMLCTFLAEERLRMKSRMQIPKEKSVATHFSFGINESRRLNSYLKSGFHSMRSDRSWVRR